MCIRPSPPRQPSDKQLLTGAAASVSVTVSGEEPATVGTARNAAAPTAAAAAAPHRNPIVDVLSRAAAVLLAQQQRREFAAVAPPARTNPSASPPIAMPAEQRREIQRMEWERLHPLLGVLGETAAVDSVPDTPLPAHAASSPTTGRRRRPRRTLRGPQGKRLSVEVHPLQLLEDLESGVSGAWSTTTEGDNGDSSPARRRRAGRRPRQRQQRPRRVRRRAESVDSTDSTVAATATSAPAPAAKQ